MSMNCYSPKVPYFNWMSEAACTGVSDKFDSDSAGEETDVAKEICRDCPVRAQCLSYVLSFERLYRYGVFGGFVPKEREALSRIGWKLGDPLPPVRLAREGYIQRRLW